MIFDYLIIKFSKIIIKLEFLLIFYTNKIKFLVGDLKSPINLFTKLVLI